MKKEDDIDFVARHYRKGLFSADRSWKRLGIVTSGTWRRFRTVAAAVALVVISATAFVVYRHVDFNHEQPSDSTHREIISPAHTVRAIDFEDAPLPEVVAEIESLYGVRVANVPDDSEEYHLSLHYEGNAIDLVETINDILSTEMIVEEL